MKLRWRYTLLGLLAALVSTPAWAVDLTGEWKGDDGGRYYITQKGEKVYWYGEQRRRNPGWSNIFVGHFRNSSTIRGKWVDVPKGRTRNHGQLFLRVRNGGNVIVVRRKTGGFGGSKWTRVGHSARPTPAPAPRPAPRARLDEDCVSFNPRSTSLRRSGRDWRVVDGRHSMFAFGRKRAEARKTLRIIRHYRMSKSCFVGRPHASFKYMLVGNRAPSGAMRGEDCIGFNPRSATVRKKRGRWKIVDGSHWLFDFGNKESEARKALRIIKKYRFTKSCYVGRPHPSFQYLRK